MVLITVIVDEGAVDVVCEAGIVVGLERLRSEDFCSKLLLMVVVVNFVVIVDEVEVICDTALELVVERGRVNLAWNMLSMLFCFVNIFLYLK